MVVEGLRGTIVMMGLGLYLIECSSYTVYKIANNYTLEIHGGHLHKL